MFSTFRSRYIYLYGKIIDLFSIIHTENIFWLLSKLTASSLICLKKVECCTHFRTFIYWWNNQILCDFFLFITSSSNSHRYNGNDKTKSTRRMYHRSPISSQNNKKTKPLFTVQLDYNTTTITTTTIYYNFIEGNVYDVSPSIASQTVA